MGAFNLIDLAARKAFACAAGLESRSVLAAQCKELVGITGSARELRALLEGVAWELEATGNPAGCADTLLSRAAKICNIEIHEQKTAAVSLTFRSFSDLSEHEVECVSDSDSIAELTSSADLDWISDSEIFDALEFVATQFDTNPRGLKNRIREKLGCGIEKIRVRVLEADLSDFLSDVCTKIGGKGGKHFDALALVLAALEGESAKAKIAKAKSDLVLAEAVAVAIGNRKAKKGGLG